jgi:hypothetical protein
VTDRDPYDVAPVRSEPRGTKGRHGQRESPQTNAYADDQRFSNVVIPPSPARYPGSASALDAGLLAFIGAAFLHYGTKHRHLEGVPLALMGGALLFGAARLIEADRPTPPGPPLPSEHTDVLLPPKGAFAPPSLATLEETMTSLRQTIQFAFPGAQFLDVEIESIVQAVVTSIGWAVQRSVEQEDDTRLRSVVAFSTSDGFGSEWMPRNEIVERICLMAGITRPQAEQALAGMEQSLSAALDRSGRARVAHLGMVRRSGDGYAIQLDEELQLHPFEWGV